MTPANKKSSTNLTSMPVAIIIQTILIITSSKRVKLSYGERKRNSLDVSETFYTGNDSEI